jgi:hypothetical protein
MFHKYLLINKDYSTKNFFVNVFLKDCYFYTGEKINVGELNKKIHLVDGQVFILCNDISFSISLVMISVLQWMQFNSIKNGKEVKYNILLFTFNSLLKLLHIYTWEKSVYLFKIIYLLIRYTLHSIFILPFTMDSKIEKKFL